MSAAAAVSSISYVQPHARVEQERKSRAKGEAEGRLVVTGKVVTVKMFTSFQKGLFLIGKFFNLDHHLASETFGAILSEITATVKTKKSEETQQSMVSVKEKSVHYFINDLALLITKFGVHSPYQLIRSANYLREQASVHFLKDPINLAMRMGIDLMMVEANADGNIDSQKKVMFDFYALEVERIDHFQKAFCQIIHSLQNSFRELTEETSLDKESLGKMDTNLDEHEQSLFNKIFEEMDGFFKPEISKCVKNYYNLLRELILIPLKIQCLREILFHQLLVPPVIKSALSEDDLSDFAKEELRETLTGIFVEFLPEKTKPFQTMVLSVLDFYEMPVFITDISDLFYDDIFLFCEKPLQGYVDQVRENTESVYSLWHDFLQPQPKAVKDDNTTETQTHGE